jgi:hypothetical protein
MVLKKEDFVRGNGRENRHNLGVDFSMTGARRMAKVNKADEPKINTKVNNRLRPARPFDCRVRPGERKFV